MARLVSLATAKRHLRVDHDASNTDIDLKVIQASDIVLDYLKSRVHRVATITSSSVASPTVITTDEAHGYVNGELVVIADHEDSLPALYGPYVVSAVTEFTFTVPVAVTVAGSGGTGTVEWTEATVPRQVQAAVLLMLTRLYEQRGDDEKADADCWAAIERLLMRSRDPALA